MKNDWWWQWFLRNESPPCRIPSMDNIVIVSWAHISVTTFKLASKWAFTSTSKNAVQPKRKMMCRETVEVNSIQYFVWHVEITLISSFHAALGIHNCYVCICLLLLSCITYTISIYHRTSTPFRHHFILCNFECRQSWSANSFAFNTQQCTTVQLEYHYFVFCYSRFRYRRIRFTFVWFQVETKNRNNGHNNPTVSIHVQTCISDQNCQLKLKNEAKPAKSKPRDRNEGNVYNVLHIHNRKQSKGENKVGMP